ncbi:hypothetical protein [Pyxidicoccus trucidator]|uniref:hypothetical protein n=1 Tax=Pyxidicoccus trucidator TaxID=2709662 RepID=UPI0019678E66|nr:hypothetical protein [Pyxidicoccus trucidator]
MGDDIDSVTRVHREKGLSQDWVVFHVGLGMSAFRASDGRYAWFEGQSDAPSQLFDSLDDWYLGTLRAEYTGRYGL